MASSDPKIGGSRAASALKDQGNAAFKKGDYGLAVEHYSAAMRADPSDAVLPCNRSMAHLKLSQWKEAKRDATKSLDIQPVGNGKAHFRRGMANKALGDFAAAQPDFEAALALDPTNKSIVAELEQVKQKTMASPAPAPTLESSVPDPVPSASSTGAAGPSRTKQLKAAITPSSSSPGGLESGDTFLREVSTTRKGKTSAGPASRLEAEPMVGVEHAVSGPSTTGSAGFAALKKAREDRQSSRPFASQPRVQSRQPPGIPTSAPTRSEGEFRDFADFERRWKSSEDANARWQVLKCLEPEKVPRIFGEHLEPEVLEDMVRVTTASSASDVPARLEVLRSLAGVHRFDLLTMFLDASIRKRLQDFVTTAAPAHRSLATSVAQTWRLSQS